MAAPAIKRAPASVARTSAKPTPAAAPARRGGSSPLAVALAPAPPVFRLGGDRAATSDSSSLHVSSPHDASEKEATATARKIVRMPVAESSVAFVKTEGGGVFRQVTETASGRVIQRQADGKATADASTAAKIRSNMAGGAPLPLAVRKFMEPRFRGDFSKVKVHTGEPAAKLNKQLNAHAFTVGNHVFFGKDKFKPESEEGKELIAHELTHTIQQGAAVQRSEVSVTHHTPMHAQRLGLSDALDYFADKANVIPGFRMFTIVLGVNPINMTRVERSAANILRALIELLPGGGLITQALDSSGVFEKAGSWVEGQIKSLGMVGSAIKQAVTDFLGSLSWSDIFDLGGVWNRAKRIFTEPIDRIIAFAKGLVAGIIELIKEAILRPIAKLAEGTNGYALLKAVLGKDPITGDPVPRTAETLIAPFMKMIGQEEIWNNMQKANAIPRAWAWFQGAMAAVIAFVSEIPTLFINAFKALQISDIVQIPTAFGRIVGIFGSFLGRFASWALGAMWNLLEIIFDVVSPGALKYIKKTGAAIKSIFRNPLPFVGNLVKAAKLGFTNFAGNFGNHLKAGLIEWLTGSLPGVYIPKGFSLGEIVKFVFSVLGLTWQNIRAKLVKAIGETPVKVMEEGFSIVVTLVREGPAAAWEQIKAQLSNLKDMVIGGITDMVVDMAVKKAVPKILAMFIPGAGFISAILSIYDTVMVFVEKISKIAQVVMAFIDSIVAIAGGAIGAAAKRVESVLAGLLSLAISLLAGFAGFGKVADKVMAVVKKVRAPIDKALDALINWIVTTGKKLFSRAFGKDKDGKPDTRTDAEKRADLDKALKETNAVLAQEGRRRKVEAKLVQIRQRYRLTKAQVAVDETKKGTTIFHADLEVNPVAKSNKAGEMDFIDPPVSVNPLFHCKKSLDQDEFRRQLTLQQETMNGMHVFGWLDRVTKFADTKTRNKEGTKKQRETLVEHYNAFRAKVISERMQVYRDPPNNLSSPDALDKATGFANRLLAYTTAGDGRRRFKISRLTDSMDNGRVIDNELFRKAALHALDQVAGGEGADVRGLGGSREDFSLGAQWRGKRINNLKTAIEAQVKGKSDDERRNIRMTANLGATYET